MADQKAENPSKWQQYFVGFIKMHFLRRFLALIAIISASSALIERLSYLFFNRPSIEKLFTLSLNGVYQGYLWQFFTYPFFPITDGLGITFGTLFEVGFPLLIIWQIGQDLIERLGIKYFLLIFFSSSALTGIATLLFAAATSYPTALGGTLAPALTLLTLWCCFFRSANIFLFFVFPIKAEWIPKGILIFQLFSFLSNFNFRNLAFTFSSVGIGYAVDFLLSRFDSFSDFFLAIKEQASSCFRPFFSKFLKKKKATIVDFKTGKPLSDDDIFVDEMLNKISKEGRDSLSEKEKEKLDKILRNKH